MKLPVLAYGSAALRKKSAEIGPDFPELSALIADLFETMYASNGVGLAAPQVGKNIRLFVIDANPYAEAYPDGKDFKKVFINPQIVSFEGEEWTMNEGCLSVPEVREDVTRKSDIVMRYCDENFNPFEERFSGIQSRIIQHEYDHLEGVVFTDRISNLRKMVIRGKLNNISKGNVDPDYKMVFPLQKRKPY